jgi:hypothetical protein
MSRLEVYSKKGNISGVKRKRSKRVAVPDQVQQIKANRDRHQSLSAAAGTQFLAEGSFALGSPFTRAMLLSHGTGG